MLEFEEEYMLVKCWVDYEDSGVVYKLVISYLCLVVKIVMGYCGYGLLQVEVVFEVNVGLMQVVKWFDFEKGFCLVIYVMWWICVSIQEYILCSWSFVKFGIILVQKKLFFNLCKVKVCIGVLEEGDLCLENVKQIVNDFGVIEDEVILMNCWMFGGDVLLNVIIGSEDEGSVQWQDWLEDEIVNQVVDYEVCNEMDVQCELLVEVMFVLNDCEKDILVQCCLQDQVVMFEDLLI